ncbi:MAG TPA: hypothetical protein ENI23_01635 [bacterium]|nr:hypothetical protein [bacterium]
MKPLTKKTLEIGTFQDKEGNPTMGLMIQTAYPIDQMQEILKNQEKAEKWDKYSKQFETALQLYSNAKTIDEFFLKNKLPQFIININDEAKILLKQTHDREIVERLKKLIEMNIHSHFPSENTIPIRELQKIMEDKSVKKIG